MCFVVVLKAGLQTMLGMFKKDMALVVLCSMYTKCGNSFILSSLLASAFFPSLFPSSPYTLPFLFVDSSLLPSLLPSSPYTLPFLFVDSSLLLPSLFPSSPFTLLPYVQAYLLLSTMCMTISCLLLDARCCLHVLSVWVRPPQCTTVVRHSQEV